MHSCEPGREVGKSLLVEERQYGKAHGSDTVQGIMGISGAKKMLVRWADPRSPSTVPSCAPHGGEVHSTPSSALIGWP